MTNETNWLEELQHRVRWLIADRVSLDVEVEFDNEMRRIEIAGWNDWCNLAMICANKQNIAYFYHDKLNEIILAYQRIYEHKLNHKIPFFESIIEDDGAEKSIEYLLRFALRDFSLKSCDEPKTMDITLKGKISAKAMVWLVTVVGFIRTNAGHNTDVLDKFDAFAEKFNELVPKRPLPADPQGRTVAENHSAPEALTTSESHLVNNKSDKKTSPRGHNGIPQERHSQVHSVKVNKPATTSKPSQPPKLEEPVTLILVFASEHLSALQAFAQNKEAFADSAALLKKYEWCWYGATRSVQQPQLDNTINPNMCWLQLNFKKPGDPNQLYDPLKVTDWIDDLQKSPSAFIENVITSERGFDFENSGLKAKGYIKK